MDQQEIHNRSQACHKMFKVLYIWIFYVFLGPSYLQVDACGEPFNVKPFITGGQKIERGDLPW